MAKRDDVLLPERRPAARLLFIEDEEMVGARTALFGSLRGGPSPLRALAEVAQGLGHEVAFAARYTLINDVAPEVVLLDATARGVLDSLATLREARTEGEPTVLVVVSGKLREEFAETLRALGAHDVLAIEAARTEIQCRLESAVALFRARAEIAHLRDQATRQMRVDDVTGVMSRRFFFQQAHRECSRSRRYGHHLSCLMVEVDHYKSLLATYGAAAADHVLRSVATILGQWTRDCDVIARFSPSKFVVLLPETAIDGATIAREKLHQALDEHHWHYGDSDLPVTVSIGEAELERGPWLGRSSAENAGFISEGDEVGEAALSAREALAGLLEDADAALYIARKGARTPDVFVPYTLAPPAAAKSGEHVATARVRRRGSSTRTSSPPPEDE